MPRRVRRGDERPGRSGWFVIMSVITTRSGRRSPCPVGWGCTRKRCGRGIRQAAVDAGEVPGVSSESAAQIRELKRKNAELEQTIEIL